jgi:hypothetical protein
MISFDLCPNVGIDGDVLLTSSSRTNSALTSNSDLACASA